MTCSRALIATASRSSEDRSIASASAAPTPASMMASSRPLRAARDAVDGHKVWELDPDQIIDTRVADRLSHDDVADLRDSIEMSGQTVPILVRRHPSQDDKYLLVYGRRRLEAIKSSDKVHKIRALIANLSDDHAVQAQISENMARRDLSYIEKALFAQELINSGFGTQTRVAEVLTVTKSSISMALAVVDAIGVDLVRAIGSAHGIGRPRWDTLATAVGETRVKIADLIDVAERTRAMAAVDTFSDDVAGAYIDPTVQAFEAVLKRATSRIDSKTPAIDPKSEKRTLMLDGQKSGSVTRTKTGMRLELDQGEFADWIGDQAQALMQDLHARWKQRGTPID